MQGDWSQASTASVAQACAEQTREERVSGTRADPCFELFKRAFSNPADQDAWQAILAKYERLIKAWLGGWDSEDAVQDVFLRFWRAQQGAGGTFESRFPNIRAVMGYLQRCAFAERFERSRAYKREKLLLERLQGEPRVGEIVGALSGPDPSHVGLRELLRGKLKTDFERIVFELSYVYGLAPRDIYAMRTDLFGSAQAVGRVKENLLKRLRRDKEIREWVGGGKPGGSDVQ
jgi:DNA-directed RNA polymerase specialized sigma24 family protein